MVNKKKRRQNIYRLIKDNRFIKVSDLEKSFQVSAPTIRKDLTALEENGLIKRSHGFARISDDYKTVRITPFETRERLNLREKEAIARRAVKFIEEGDSIILNAGTTTLQIAKLLADRRNLTIFTNSLSIASVFNVSRVSVILISGIYVSEDFATHGPETERFLRTIRVGKAFISSSGIRADFGLACSDSLDASLLRAIAYSSEKTYAVMDSSKLIKTNIYPSVSFQELECLITDSEIQDKELAAALTKAGTPVILP
ncbi:MAG: DeoR/GlpR family DNA-binding transcription regulator [Bilifractor sp.]|jgi:DeoR/GlpR family transcriptional regulator of sugar metabolism